MRQNLAGMFHRMFVSKKRQEKTPTDFRLRIKNKHVKVIKSHVFFSAISLKQFFVVTSLALSVTSSASDPVRSQVGVPSHVQQSCWERVKSCHEQRLWLSNFLDKSTQQPTVYRWVGEHLTSDFCPERNGTNNGRVSTVTMTSRNHYMRLQCVFLSNS